MIDNEVLVRHVAACVPDVEDRLERFTVDASEVDDEMMGIFIQQFQIDINGIEEAMRTGDLVSAANHAHSIKGMGGTAGMPSISVLAEELERTAKAKNAGGLTPLKTILDTCFELIKVWNPPVA